MASNLQDIPSHFTLSVETNPKNSSCSFDASLLNLEGFCFHRQFPFYYNFVIHGITLVPKSQGIDLNIPTFYDPYSEEIILSGYTININEREGLENQESTISLLPLSLLLVEVDYISHKKYEMV